MRRDVVEMDPRLAARRAQVAEGRARRSLVRLLWLLLLVAVGGLVAWVLRSPFMAVEEIVISGAVRSDPSVAVAEQGVATGMPMISVDPGRVEAAIEEDPWVASATARRDWPRRLTISIVERVPLAWAQTADGWSHVAVDGVALEEGGLPPERAPLLLAPGLTLEGLAGDEAALGALLFIESLRDDLVPGMAVHVVDAQVDVRLGPVEVRLGRAIDMERKARALAAVIDGGVAPGSVVTLIAPTRPAILPPGTIEGGTAEIEAPSGDGESGEDGP